MIFITPTIPSQLKLKAVTEPPDKNKEIFLVFWSMYIRFVSIVSLDLRILKILSDRYNFNIALPQ